jgi:hypothetical protein
MLRNRHLHMHSGLPRHSSSPRHSGESRNPGEHIHPSHQRRPASSATDRIPACAGMTRIGSNDVFIQIAPRRVCGLDQIEFPRTTPVLDGLLARDGRFHRLVRLEPDQRMNAVFLREPFRKIVLVLPNALNKIGGHADIKRAVSAAGEDVDAWLLHERRVLDSGVRRNDGRVRNAGRAAG